MKRCKFYISACAGGQRPPLLLAKLADFFNMAACVHFDTLLFLFIYGWSGSSKTSLTKSSGSRWIGQDHDGLLRAFRYKCLWTLAATVWVWNSINWIKILFSQTAAAFLTYMATGTRGEDTESQFVLYVGLCYYFPPDLPLENFKEWSRAREWSAFLLTEAGRQRHGLSKSYINLQSPLFCFFWQPCKIHPSRSQASSSPSLFLSGSLQLYLLELIEHLRKLGDLQDNRDLRLRNLLNEPLHLWLEYCGRKCFRATLRAPRLSWTRAGKGVDIWQTVYDITKKRPADGWEGVNRNTSPG